VLGNPTNGPDAMDCSIYLRQVELTHNCASSVIMDAVGLHAGDGWRISAVSTSRSLLGDTPAWSAATVVLWPSNEHATIEAALYALIAAHDHECTRRSFWEEVNLK
jgi:hypothetical protein